MADAGEPAAPSSTAAIARVPAARRTLAGRERRAVFIGIPLLAGV